MQWNKRNNCPVILLIIVVVIAASLILIRQFHLTEQYFMPSSCPSNLHAIYLAMETYHLTYGTYPPPAIYDSNGKAIHSWRALILPYLDVESKFNYKFDEPWNGPHNITLHDKMPAFFRCSGVRPGKTISHGNFPCYMMILEPSKTNAIKNSDVKDDPSTTIFLVEVANTGVNWLEPKDMPIENMALPVRTSIKQAESPIRPGSFSCEPYNPDFHILTYSGDIYHVSPKTPPVALRAMATINGKESMHILKINNGTRSIFKIFDPSPVPVQQLTDDPKTEGETAKPEQK